MSGQPWIGSYPAGVRWDAEIVPGPVHKILDDTVAKWPDHPAIDFMGKRISYRQLGDLADRAARGLQQLGVRPGVHVGLFLPNTPNESSHSSKSKDLFVSDAFTNAAHVHFALKVTLAGMFCYIVYMAIDWTGIHTALITCTFIALESTEATLYKGTLRIVGCVIGGALALFTIVFLMPHMETIASLVVVVACASAIAGWVATGSERISYAGLQIAFAFFYGLFQGFAPDTDLDNVRDRVVGILFGLIVTGLVFQYIWPERAQLTPRTSE